MRLTNGLPCKEPCSRAPPSSDHKGNRQALLVLRCAGCIRAGTARPPTSRMDWRPRCQKRFPVLGVPGMFVRQRSTPALRQSPFLSIVDAADPLFDRRAYVAFSRAISNSYRARRWARQPSQLHAHRSAESEGELGAPLMRATSDLKHMLKAVVGSVGRNPDLSRARRSFGYHFLTFVAENVTRECRGVATPPDPALLPLPKSASTHHPPKDMLFMEKAFAKD